MQKNRITKQGYTLCFLDRLQDALRRRDIYVGNSDRWGDPRAKLLQGQEWKVNRNQVCRSLGHPPRPREAINQLAQRLDATYKQVATNFGQNKAVELDLSGNRPSPTITNLDKLDEQPSQKVLSQRVDSLLPNVDLTELLLEIHEHTGFADEFTHVTESNARAEDITTSICAVLVAEACNIGLEPLIKHQLPALSRHRLNWVKQNYLRAETLTRGNAKLVDYQFSRRIADAGESVFWRIDKTADYGALDELAHGLINTHKIEQHWNDMMRIAGSLKLGTIQASELIRTLLKSDRPSSLAQAIIEAGRVSFS